jgi:tellurite resistance protein TerC
MVKKIIISVVGFTVLLIGIALIFLPGPAIVVIPIGLVILAGEFVWAKSLLDKLKNQMSNAGKKLKKSL